MGFNFLYLPLKISIEFLKVDPKSKPLRLKDNLFWHITRLFILMIEFWIHQPRKKEIESLSIQNDWDLKYTPFQGCLYRVCSVCICTHRSLKIFYLHPRKLKVLSLWFDKVGVFFQFLIDLHTWSEIHKDAPALGSCNM